MATSAAANIKHRINVPQCATIRRMTQGNIYVETDAGA